MDLQGLFLSSIDELLRVRPGSRRLVIAVSGGRDSMALLDLCVRSSDQLPFELSAIHVNHGWSANALRWEQHVSAICQQHNVSLAVRRLQLDRSVGMSPEEQAREARYACFSALLQPQDVLLTAHHQADQAETVLLNLFRGSGPRGLSGIPQGRVLGNSWVWRPLLEVESSKIHHYATSRQLSWVEDESNQDGRYRRNFLRHSIAPLLSTHWPGWQASVARSAGLCRDLDALTDRLALQGLDSVMAEDGALDIKALQGLPIVQQQLIVRHWLSSVAGKWPTQQAVISLLQQVANASHDAQPALEWQGWVVRREHGRLLLAQREITIPPLPWNVFWGRAADGRFPKINLPGNGCLEMRRAVAPAMTLPPGQFRITYRHGGEKIRLPGRPRRTLKKLLQEAGVPAWQRQRLPLLWIDDQLAWVAGVGFDEQFMCHEPSAGWLPVWLKESP
jgi:tRNA(Ile)-lysidine synthase